MNRLLEVALRQICSPHCRSTYLTPFADEQISWFEGELTLLPQRELHLGYIIYINVVPGHVRVPNVSIP
jgi:hypothetical protein